MSLLPRLLFLTFILLKAGPCLAQQGETASSTPVEGVIIHADPRLAIITSTVKAKNASGKSGLIRSGRGFRVQIYNGNDRDKAIQTKIDFMRRFPNTRTYMTYIQPQFRVKVGDFRTRADAQKFAQQLNGVYSPIMIVPDIIVINTLK